MLNFVLLRPYKTKNERDSREDGVKERTSKKSGGMNGKIVYEATAVEIQ